MHFNHSPGLGKTSSMSEELIHKQRVRQIRRLLGSPWGGDRQKAKVTRRRRRQRNLFNNMSKIHKLEYRLLMDRCYNQLPQYSRHQLKEIYVKDQSKLYEALGEFYRVWSANDVGIWQMASPRNGHRVYSKEVLERELKEHVENGKRILSNS